MGKDPTGAPQFTIIIAARNAAATIEGTLASALEQTYPSVEILVVDGASTDGTVSMIERHAKHLTWWLSEPDRGIGDAWNKGLAKATGSLIVLLNADDELSPNYCATVAAAMDPSRPMVAYGDTILLDHTGRTVRQWHGRYDPDQLARGFGFWHTSCVVTRAAYDVVGPFDTNLRIAVDTDWLLRAVRAGVPMVPHGASNYMRIGGTSTRRPLAARREYASLLRRHDFEGGRGIQRMRGDISSAVTQLIGFARWSRWRRQAALVMIAAFNFSYRAAPSWTLRRLLLRRWGIAVGPASAIHTPVRFLSRGRISIGARSLVNRDCVLDNRLAIEIGNDVSIAQGVRIFTLGHDVDDRYFASRGAPVVIGDRAVVFAGAMLMPGCQVGEGAVVLPGAVVAGSVSPWTVVGGVPASVIRMRSSDQRYVLDMPFHLQV
jgi:acetyltransferase-like isoleucine patch superfamily enzyme/GT2 family glycosyltransferase